MAAASINARALLARLDRIRAEFGPGRAAAKFALLRRLGPLSLNSAAAVLRFHEALCFLRAYPDDARLLRRVERLLAGFERRADLSRFRAELVDSGIAGTDTGYVFFADTARWLASRWPDRLTVAWEDQGDSDRLEGRLNMLGTDPESPGLDEVDLGTRAWIDRLKGPRETDAAFIVRRFGQLPVEGVLRDQFYEEMQLFLKLAWGKGGLARTHERLPGLPVHYQTGPLHRARPDIWETSYLRPRAVRPVSPAAGRRVVELAREAMVGRSRDLDVFIHGDPRDVRIVEFDEGLAFAAIGFKPARRLMLESVYGFLTLKNGVPIGYVLSSALNRSVEVAYNVFDTWRGNEAAHIYGRVLAMLRHLFGAEAFMVPPYQLGHDNEEGLESGAWWFYQKLGFRPRPRRIVALMNRELGRMARRPGYRSDLATLQELSSVNMYLERGPRRRDILGIYRLDAIGLAVTDELAARFGADRDRGLKVCAEEALRRLRVRNLLSWTREERLAFARWAPLVCLLSDLGRWPAADRRALVRVIRAKGGRRESDFVRAFDSHARLRASLLQVIGPVRY